MKDAGIQARIETLEAEERRLRADEAEPGGPDREQRLAADRDRLAAIKVELDQLWDLRRQREALRRNGQDPDGARMRDAGTVENYLQ
jgi:hypothetical protein